MIKINWIEPGVLAASSIPLGKADLRVLHEQGIGAIVTLTEHPLTIQREITDKVFTEFDLISFHAPIPDGFPPDIETAQRITGFIEQMAAQGRATLVHCHAGQGRTGTILHLYYLSRGLTLEQAQDRVKSQRPMCNFVALSETQRVFLEDFAKAQRQNLSN